MKYIKRHAERKFLNMSDFFKAVLVTGARQVGKTTMLHHLAKERKRTYVSLDNLMARNLAKTDPVLFFQTYKPPIIIDEIQYAPELFSRIKILCDESEETGLFWLTGSQRYSMMKNVRETLAGRIGILEMYSLTINEKDNVNFGDEPDFSLACFQARQALTSKNDAAHVFDHIWRGGMPQAVNADAEQLREYFDAYINSYVMRDVAELRGITDSLRFGKFLTACAALISTQINFKTLAEAAEISQPTAKDWLRLLESMGIVYLLRPYANNALKRLTKTPKLYFCDTGLAAHLSMWTTKETLMNGAVAGHYFENFVVTQLLKNFSYSPKKAVLSYYRDSNAKEIDIFVEQDGFVHPLEIKKSANPDTLVAWASSSRRERPAREVKKFAVLEKAATKQGFGGIICMCEEVIPIDSGNCFIPCNLV